MLLRSTFPSWGPEVLSTALSFVMAFFPGGFGLCCLSGMLICIQMDDSGVVTTGVSSRKKHKGVPPSDISRSPE